MKANHSHNASFFHLISVPCEREKCVKAKGSIFWIIKKTIIKRCPVLGGKHSKSK